jgi:hypothetical protein
LRLSIFAGFQVLKISYLTLYSIYRQFPLSLERHPGFGGVGTGYSSLSGAGLTTHFRTSS